MTIYAAFIDRILPRLMLCFALASVCSCRYPEDECVEEQEAAIIKISGNGFDDRYFDSLVVKKNKVLIGSGLGNINIGSKSNKVEFPVHINILFFLHGFLLKNLEFEIPDNSVLTFYNGKECEIIPDSMSNSSGDIYRWEREGVFFEDVRNVKDNKTFIDSSRSGNLCWIMTQMNEYDNYYRCAKWETN